MQDFGKPIAEYSADDLRAQYHAGKACNVACTLGCARSCSQVDELFAQRGTARAPRV
jgi:hypothetical protein